MILQTRDSMRPVSVLVITVVVMPFTPMRRAATPCTPIANASSAMSTRWDERGVIEMSAAKTARAASSKVSSLVTAGVQPTSFCRCHINLAAAAAPAIKPRMAETYPSGENADSWMSDRPSSTVLPVMAAVNTWPSARKLIASTQPEVMVSTINKMLRVDEDSNGIDDLSKQFNRPTSMTMRHACSSNDKGQCEKQQSRTDDLLRSPDCMMFGYGG